VLVARSLSDVWRKHDAADVFEKGGQKFDGLYSSVDVPIFVPEPEMPLWESLTEHQLERFMFVIWVFKS
jgi:hypothetical protein